MPSIKLNLIWENKEGVRGATIITNVDKEMLKKMKKYDIGIKEWANSQIASKILKFAEGRKYVKDLEKIQILEFVLPEEIIQEKTDERKRILDKVVREVTEKVMDYRDALDFKIILKNSKLETRIEIDPKKVKSDLSKKKEEKGKLVKKVYHWRKTDFKDVEKVKKLYEEVDTLVRHAKKRGILVEIEFAIDKPPREIVKALGETGDKHGVLVIVLWNNTALVSL